MALGHGTSKITDGLVFAYDMANTKKSWIGAPAFNASLQNGQNDISPWFGDGGPTSLGIDPIVKFRGRKVAKFLTGTSGNCYINGAADLSTSTNSTGWTSTIYFKRVDGTPMASVGMYLYITNNTNVNQVVSVTEVEEGWYKAVYTRSGLVSGYPTLAGMYSLGVGIEYYFADWQVENNSFSSSLVFGTRSNTESILDLTSKYTLTANSLNYYSDNTFDFSTGNINIPYSSDFDFSLEQSIVMWIKPGTGASSARRNPYNQAYGGSGTITHETNGVFNYYFGTNGGNSTPYVGRSSTFTVLENELAHIAVTRNQTTNTVRWYKNGQLISTLDAGSYPSTNNGSSPIIIGTGYTTNFIGQIPRVLVYKKELSPSQILEDYQSTKGRYML